MKTEWVHKKLGDLGYSYSGLSGKTIDDFGEGKPFIPYMNIFSNGEIDPNKLEYVRIAENEHQNKVEQGDWFFTTSSETPEEVGMTSVLVDNIGEAYLNSFCFGFRLYNKQEFDPKFASYLFRSEELRKKISLFAQGSTRYNLPKQQMFEKLFISYPESLSAQRRIAAILASADKVIAATQKLIAKYKQMKQGMMEELFNEQCTMNNVQWKKVRLEECLTIGNGQDYKHLQSGEIPVYGTGGVMTYVDDYLYDGETVCIGRKGTINKPIYHTGKIWTVDTLFYTHSFVGVVPLFIYYIFCNVDWNKYNEATGVPSLSKETIYKIEISIPDLAEQCRIATILSGIDAKIATEEKVLEKYEKVKKGLMERLLNEQCTMNN